MDYHDSPTGKVDVGKSNPPLMPTENYGFLGVVLQTHDGSAVQCNECGQWGRTIHPKHLATHDLTPLSYKLKYSIGRLQVLSCDQYREEKRVACIERKSYLNLSPFTKEQRKKGIKAVLKIRNGKTNGSMTRRNKTGSCPLQLMKRVRDYIHENHELPTQAKEENLIGLLKYYYGSRNIAFEEWGLPTVEKVGHWNYIRFPDGSEEKYGNYADAEFLYSKIIEKCPQFFN